MRVPALLLALALAAGCSSGSSPTATKTPTPTSTATSSHEPYADLAPPDSPGIGDFDRLVANRAYVATQGNLAAELLEPTTLTGSGDAVLAKLLQGASGDPAPARALASTPTTKGLLYRPLFARGVTVGKPTIVRSVYTGDAVTSLGGETAMRINWSGTVHYAVTLRGAAHTVAFSLNIAFVYTLDAVDRTGVTLQVSVPGTSHAAPVEAACLAKGVLLPVAGTLTAVDDSAGPWPAAPAGGACPV